MTKTKPHMTVRQLGAKIAQIFLGYCVVFTCLSWVSMSYPKQVGTFIDYVNDLETGDKKRDPVQVNEPDNEKPKGKIIYV